MDANACLWHGIGLLGFAHASSSANNERSAIAAGPKYFKLSLLALKLTHLKSPLAFRSQLLALTVLVVATAGLFSFSAPGRVSKVQLHMESTTVEKGKKLISKGEMYFEAGEGRLISHFTYPLEQVLVSNRFGEVKMYDPNANAVAIKQDAASVPKARCSTFSLLPMLPILACARWAFRSAILSTMSSTW